MGQSKSGTSSTSPSPQGIAALNAVLPQVQQYLNPATNPYVPVMQRTAQQNPEQLAAVGNYNAAFGAANTGLGTYEQAQSLAQGAAQPLSQAEIDRYFNPYVNDVVNAAQRQFTLQNAQQQNQVVGNETAQGALGGNRTAVAGALTAGQQAAAQDPIIAGMLQAGYTQQEAMAAQQYQQIPLAAASALQQIGAGQESAAGNIGNLGLGQYGLGTQQQQYYTPGTPTTATLNALYAEQLAKFGYPIQLTNMAAGDIGSLAGAYGSTTTTTPPAPSIVSGLTGLGVLGVGAGTLFGGKRGGRVPRQNGGKVQGLQTGGVPAIPYGASPVSGLGPMPYAGGGSYIPQGMAVNIPRLQAAPSMPEQQDDASKMFTQALQLSKLGSGSGPLTNTSLGNTVGDAMQDFRMDTLGMSEAAGGRVPRAYGGLAMPSSNRINVPMRGGFGMPSFMARGGLAEGGTPDDDVAAAALDVAPEQVASPPPIVVSQPGRIETGPAPSTETLPAEITAGASKPKGLNAVQQKVWDEAVRQGVSPNLALGVLHAESADGRNPSTSSAGALGPMQLMPQTARGLGVNPYKEDDNIRGGVTYLKQMRDQFGSDALAAAAYNAGPGRVNQYQNGVPLPAETQGYVPKVLGFAGNPSGAPEGGLATTSPDTGGIPGVTPIKAPDISGKAKSDKTDIALSLMAAGLGMMGSRSPYAGVGIGQGGMQGIGTYEALHKQRMGEAEHQAQLEQQANITNLHAGLQAAAQRETHEYHGAEIQHQKDVLSKTIVPGTAQDENGNLVPGAYQWDESQKQMVFRPGMMVGKQSDNAKNAEQQAWTRDFYSKNKRLPSGDEIAAHQRELKNASGLDTGIVNETENYPDLKGKAGTLNIDKANQVKVKSAFQSSAHLENIAKYTTEHPGAIGLLAKASNQLNLDAYKGILDGGFAATKGAADMEKAIDAVASGNVDDVAAAKVLNKMLITQAFNDASASGQRGGVYLDKVFRDLYQQASSPKAFFGILGQRYEDANNTLKPYGLGFDKRSDKESFPFWERLHGHGTEPSTTPFTPPAGWQFSPSRKQYRDEKGNMYDINGKPING